VIRNDELERIVLMASAKVIMQLSSGDEEGMQILTIYHIRVEI
jgi:hypothetical protein